ncbi:23S rRNA m(5)U-1939 methyltransferase [Dongia mobilis]|uniref:23S rRNA m(5)U-1939 methyltransferase n=1 Tax=Dongia mobilis TaxID=578943 RepID=A0A4R6WT21_9PROT|nr:TRAM domain-containing protein [Dongia mobilis]TDQ83158.1 23S rRNA m(5)U-1939 methyltransferase [Dongia mobilis]
MTDPAALVDLTIESLGAQGDGIARHDGKGVFVAYALPGERVRARLSPKGGNAFTGRMQEIVTASPERVVPPCPLFARCGGCGLQHYSLPAYRAWKQQQVATTLGQRGIDLPAGTGMVTVEAGNRRRAVFAARKERGEIAFGFHAAMSDEIVPLDDCLLLTPGLSAGLGGLRQLAGVALAEKQAADIHVTDSLAGLDVLVTTDGDLPMGRRQAVIAAANAAGLARLSWQHGRRQPEPIVMARVPQMRFGDILVDLPIGSFLQPSAEGEAALVAAVTTYVGKARRIADLYAGCGTFSFPLAKIGRVLAVDAAKPAIAALAAAVNRAQLSGRVEGMARDLEQSPLPPPDLKPFEAVVFDPPRAGAEMQARMLAKSRVGKVVAVSCNPASFARDARILLDAGFALEKLAIVNQFVWSAHVELVALLRRR